MHVLLDDERGRLTLKRLWPWHRLLARSQAARLDRELAGGTSPETSVTLAARAIQLTSMKVRRDLAASVQQILAAAGDPPAVMPSRGASLTNDHDTAPAPPLAISTTITVNIARITTTAAAESKASARSP